MTWNRSFGGIAIASIIAWCTPSAIAFRYSGVAPSRSEMRTSGILPPSSSVWLSQLYALEKMRGECPMSRRNLLPKGRIGTRRHIHIEVPLLCRIRHCVTILVRRISTAPRRRFFFSWRSRELPHGRILHSTQRRQRRVRHRYTSRRRRTRIVENPIGKLPRRFVGSNVLRCHNRHAAAFIHHYSGAVHNRPVSCFH